MEASELIQTVKMVHEQGVQNTATIQGIKPHSIRNKIRKLERQLGFKIFYPYDFESLTRDGEKYLQGIEQ